MKGPTGNRFIKPTVRRTYKMMREHCLNYCSAKRNSLSEESRLAPIMDEYSQPSPCNKTNANQGSSFQICFLSKQLCLRPAALLVVFLCLLQTTHAIETDACTYDIDFTTNSAKITCKGSPASVSVYANTATVQSDETYQYGGAGQGSSTAVQKHTPDTKKTSASTASSSKGERVGRKGAPSEPGKEKPDEAPQSLRSPGGKGEKKGGERQEEKRDHAYNQRLAAIHSSPFSDVVMNATHKLKRASRHLSTYSESIRNLSAYLEEGDNNLRTDMERLLKGSNSARELKEGISAALRNQFSYLRYSMTVRSHELERLVNSLSVLVDVTAVGLEGALVAHKSVLHEVAHVNRTIRSVRRKMIRELNRDKRKKKKGKDNKKPKDGCPKQISAIGRGTARKVKREINGEEVEISVGAYMREPYRTGPVQPVWIMEGSAATDQLIEYDADVDIGFNLVGTWYALPYQCVGTGHAVFRRHMYCHTVNSNRIVKYQLSQMDPVSELHLPGTGLDMFQYRGGFNSSVDLAVDEYGLWAIYANHESGGKIIITKIGHRHMELEKSWTTTFPKSHAGNAFMICGVLYVTDSSTDVPTYIRYMYDTNTSTERRLEEGELFFPNSALLGVSKDSLSGSDLATYHRANVSSLNYDFRMSKLYAWNNARIEEYPVYFKDEP